VVGEPELSQLNLFVPPDGFDYLPYIGRVQLAGRTPDDLRDELETRYGKLIDRARVFVVLNPHGGCFPFQRIITLVMDEERTEQRNLFEVGTVFSALGSIGASDRFDWRAIRVLRRVPRGRIIMVDAWEYIGNGDVWQDLPLEWGDVIYVPLRQSTDPRWSECVQYVERRITLDEALGDEH
jgi:polysaccharide export outer membrane protein